MNQLKTIDDIEAASQRVLRVKHNAPDGKLPLERVNLVIFAPHNVPEDIEGRIDTQAMAQALPKEAWPHYEYFLKNDPNAASVVGFSHYRADQGADHICRAMLEATAREGRIAVVLEPNESITLGRGVLDLNRPNASAVGDSLFTVPGKVAKDLLKMHNSAIQALFTAVQTIHKSPHSNLEIAQVHTMASGNPTQEQMKRVQALAEALPDFKDRTRETYIDPQLIAEVLTYWREVYDTMNNGNDRPHVDVILSQQGKLELPVEQRTHIGDRKAATAFRNRLIAQGISAEYDTPFGHVPGNPQQGTEPHPCTRLTQWAVANGIPEILSDVPRSALKSAGTERIPLFGFKPNPARVQIIAQAKLKALQDGRGRQ